MSILIRKKETGDIFDTMPGFKLEVNNTSAIFNDLGSKTVTTTLPKSAHNMRILEFAHRLDIQDKPSVKIPVIVSSGSYAREGMLYLSSAYNTERTFGIIIAFNEGIMYENMSNILLTELNNLPVVEKPLTELIAYMNDLFTNDNPTADLSVFAVTYKVYPYKIGETESTFGETVNRVKIVNGVNQKQLLERTETFVIKDSNFVEIKVPAGYGITPFLRVWKILELIFSHYGYKIKENPFKEHFQLQRLCVLNNTLDAIVSGVLDYKQLLPKVTIYEFLESLWCRFGLKVFFNSNTNEVSLKLIRDIFQHPDYEQTSPGSLINIDYTNPRQVKLSAAKSLDQSGTETDTFEEFLAKYNNTIGKSNIIPSSVSTGGIYYDATGGLFFQSSTINNQAKLISSVHFDWNKKDEGIEVEEITSVDECLTMRTGLNDAGGGLYYGIDTKLENSILTIDGQHSAAETDNALAFAYDMGEAYSVSAYGAKNYQGYKYGSIFPYVWKDYGEEKTLQQDKLGNTFRYALVMIGEHGAFNNFFKEYDAFLRHSNHTVKVIINTPVFDLSDIQFAQKRIIDNQPFLYDKANHLLDNNRMQPLEVEARTLRLYTPHDLAKEQALPVPDPIKYQWVMGDNQAEKILDQWDEVRDSLPKDNDAHQFVSLSPGVVIEDLSPASETTYWFLPPTEKQYQNHVKTGERVHSCKVRYVHSYYINVGTTVKPERVPKEEKIDRNVEYGSWFYPEELS